MLKSDTIEAIKEFNPTAKPEFLVEFSAGDLTDYLNKLQGLEADGGLRTSVCGDVQADSKANTATNARRY